MSRALVGTTNCLFSAGMRIPVIARRVSSTVRYLSGAYSHRRLSPSKQPKRQFGRQLPSIQSGPEVRGSGVSAPCQGQASAGDCRDTPSRGRRAGGTATFDWHKIVKSKK